MSKTRPAGDFVYGALGTDFLSHFIVEIDWKLGNTSVAWNPAPKTVDQIGTVNDVVHSAIDDV